MNRSAFKISPVQARHSASAHTARSVLRPPIRWTRRNRTFPPRRSTQRQRLSQLSRRLKAQLAAAIPQSIDGAKGLNTIPLPPVRPKEFGLADPDAKPKSQHAQPLSLEPVAELTREAVIERASAVLSAWRNFKLTSHRLMARAKKSPAGLQSARPGMMRFDV